MNLLEEEDRLTLEPFKYAFGRLFFEVLRFSPHGRLKPWHCFDSLFPHHFLQNKNIDVELPPAMDVPDTNKWTANSRQRYTSPTYRGCVCERAIAELRSFFLVVMCTG
jgi:hypothetical protein